MSVDSLQEGGDYQSHKLTNFAILMFLVSCRALIELLAFNINVPLYFNFTRLNIQRLADPSSVQEHLEKQVLGIYTNAKFSAEATVLQ